MREPKTGQPGLRFSGQPGTERNITSMAREVGEVLVRYGFERIVGAKRLQLERKLEEFCYGEREQTPRHEDCVCAAHELSVRAQELSTKAEQLAARFELLRCADGTGDGTGDKS